MNFLEKFKKLQAFLVKSYFKIMRSMRSGRGNGAIQFISSIPGHIDGQGAN